MPVQFFGQYLLANKIITREQLLEAVAYQESQNLKLGEYAIQRGYLSEEQAESVNKLQQTKDLRFGYAAVELEYLTLIQVNELLTIQRNSHIYLGEAIVHKGFTDQETIDKALSAFKSEQDQYKGVGVDLQGLDVPDPKLYAPCFDLTQKMLLRVWDINAKLSKVELKTGVLSLDGHVVQVLFTGQFNTRLILSAPKDIVAHGAMKILGDDNPDDETCDDLLREFANVVSGNIVALFAQLGKTCDIQPPVSVSGDVNLGPDKGLHVSIVTPNGNGALVLTCS
ncbi:MAG: hypothetical protein GY847_39765 [Proteobacteria bacterium]|nr:hypothetical protein [Pseudomonadota bacterium]